MTAQDLLDRIDAGMLAREMFPELWIGGDRSALSKHAQYWLAAIRKLARELEGEADERGAESDRIVANGGRPK